ncbi:MAG TPA: acyl-CoA dehydrogenase family protein, partial [Acidimicrobiales bacterium]
GAADADRCLCAAPVTAPGARVDGVAVVAVDLGLPGVRRPGTAGASGDGDDDDEAEAVLAFDGVAVGAEGIVGVRDEGWPVLRSLRARLRSLRWIGGLLAVRRALAALVEVGRSRGLADDGLFRDTIAALQVEADAVRALAYRALARQEAGRPNPELGMLPLVTARVEEHVYLAGVEALGADGLDLALDGPAGWPGGSWAAEWEAALAATAAAGGLGAERDRIAGRVLGLRVR